MTPGLRLAILVAVLVLVMAMVVVSDQCDRGAIRRDLAKKGCVLRRTAWLPGRRGLTLRVSDGDCEPGVVYGRVYRVDYTNRDGTARVAVCQMGPGRLVFWTDEHPEPGFDRHGNPPNLPTYGQSWRG